MSAGQGKPQDDEARARARANLRLAWLLGAVVLLLYLSFVVKQL